MSETDELAESAQDLPEEEEPTTEETTESEAADVAEGAVPYAEAVVDLVEAGVEELPEVEEFGEELNDLEEVAQVDLNTASADELQVLPGIGQSLAARIVDYRSDVQPFQEPADVVAVDGVSETLYARIAGQVTASPAEPAPAVEPEPGEAVAEELDAAVDEIDSEADELDEILGLEPEVVGAELEEALEPEPEPEVVEAGEKRPPGAEPPLVEVVQARVGWGRILFVGLLSALVGACLALGFLYAVNGTLDFHTATVRTVQSEVARLEGDLEALNATLSDVEGRLEAIQALEARLTEVETDTEQLAAGLETLAGELEATQDQVTSMTETMGALRQEFTNLSEDLGGLAEHVSMLATRMDDVDEQLASLSQEMENVQQAADRFNAFLDGLRELLESSEGLGQGMSPLGSSPAQTPTLRPQVTVIPLATPTPKP